MKRAALSLLLVAAAHAQFMARCSNYQTTGNFDDSFIETMRNQPGGYIVRLSNAVSDQCQRLQFIDGNDFNFTSINVATQTQQNYTDRYEVSTATVTMPAKLTLKLQPRASAVRVLGGDGSGELVLYPLVANEDMIAFASCHVGIPFMMRERVLVLTPFAHSNKTSVEDMVKVLEAQGVPRIQDLFETSMNCTPNPNATQPLSIYTIIANPFQRIAQVIPINTGDNAVISNAAGVAEQTMAFLRGQYPAYLNGQRETPAVVASSGVNAFQMAAQNQDQDKNQDQDQDQNKSKEVSEDKNQSEEIPNVDGK